MAESKRQLLLIGVFFIVLVVAILLYAFKVLKDWTLIFPTVLLLYGFCVLALAGTRSSSPQKYERSAYSTVQIGVLLVALGAAWFVFVYVGILYSIVILLLALGAIAIVSAMRKK